MGTGKKLLGIDIGTSGCKVILIDETGSILKQATSGYDFESPQSGWSQQDPNLWIQGIKDCLLQMGESRPDAIGLSGQMHGAVCLDKNQKVLRPAILWNDQRTVAQAAEIDEICTPDLMRRVTCNPPLTGFQAPKIKWIEENEPDVFDKIASVLLPKDYIRLWLTGEFASDVSDSSGTSLFDVPKRKWSSEILQKLGWNPDWFARSYESSDLTGTTRASEETGSVLDKGIPVVAGGGDQAAGAIGTGAVRPGLVSISLGTSGVVFTCLDEPRFHPDGRTHTFCDANRKWHAMSVMLSCGGSVSWLKHQIFPDLSFKDIDCLAEMAPSGSEGLIFLPYLTGERSPINDPYATGVWAGLTSRHNRCHLSRAVLEGTCFGLKSGFEAIQPLGGVGQQIRVTSGGSRSRLWVQILADIFGIPCEILEVDEGPAFGAAILAGVGIGVFPSVLQSESLIRIKETIEPSKVAIHGSFERFQSLYSDTKGWMRGDVASQSK